MEMVRVNEWGEGEDGRVGNWADGEGPLPTPTGQERQVKRYISPNCKVVALSRID